MSKLAQLPGSTLDLKTVFAIMSQNFPDATRTIVIVFNEEGVMQIMYSTTDQEMALAGARLSYLAACDK